MIGRLNHVAIAVPDLMEASAQYKQMLGASVGEPQEEPDHGVIVIFIELPNTKIELLHPLGDNSPIDAFWIRTRLGEYITFVTKLRISLKQEIISVLTERVF